MMNEFHRVSGAKRGLNRGERRKVGVLVISRYRNLYAILIHRRSGTFIKSDEPTRFFEPSILNSRTNTGFSRTMRIYIYIYKT